MNGIMLEVWCPKCGQPHQKLVEWRLVTGGHDRIADRCPHCGKALIVSYEVRGAVRYVRRVVDEWPEGAHGIQLGNRL